MGAGNRRGMAQQRSPSRGIPTRAPSRRLAHALCGADPLTLLDLARKARGLDAGGALRFALAAACSIARLPVVAAEACTVARGAASAPLGRPPVFIIGHWRSGTTHLYNVMSRSPAFAYVSPVATGLPWDFMLLDRALGPLLRALLPRDRFIDRIPVNPDSPQEDEIAIANMQPVSFYHGLYFPARFSEQLGRGLFFEGLSHGEVERWRRAVRRFLVKVERSMPGRRVLIKNPVYTARVAELEGLFPGARFIHIHRDPRRVYPSMQNFYRVLFRQLGLGPARHVDIDETILSTYPRLMARLEHDARSLPPGRLAHVAFEDFEADPIGQVRRLHDELGLEGFDAAEPGMRAYLSAVSAYRKNDYPYDPALERVLRDRWGPWLDRYGYAQPAPQRPTPQRPEGSGCDSTQAGCPVALAS